MMLGILDVLWVQRLRLVIREELLQHEGFFGVKGGLVFTILENSGPKANDLILRYRVD
jgi:hypothetical protein